MKLSAQLFDQLKRTFLSLAIDSPPSEPQLSVVDIPHQSSPKSITETLVEGAFSVQRLHITLKENSMSGDIVVGKFENIHMHLVKRNYDFKVDATLHSLAIEDRIQVNRYHIN
jgi:hypothetical protein